MKVEGIHIATLIGALMFLAIVWHEVDTAQHQWHLYELQPYEVRVSSGIESRYVGLDWFLIGSYRTLKDCEAAAADQDSYFCGLKDNRPE